MQSKGPRRIQRKRIRGWTMPPNTVYVGRPTIWGNPYKIGRQPITTALEAVESYRNYVEANQKSAERWRLPLGELRGKNLACWCALDQPCHADILLEIANEEHRA